MYLVSFNIITKGTGKGRTPITRMRVLVAVLCVTTVWGYRHFQDEIPNGAAVPHPCKTNFIWWGVGHLNPRGGGSINPFGVDFKNAGMKWTRALCEMDSDGDGETNGQELGDPDCGWTKGSVAAVTKDISHPGICTPYSDPACQAVNTWIDCELEDLDCDAKDGVGTKNMSLRIPKMAVPASMTSYYCMTYQMPSDIDYHIISLEPLVDNVNVLHHILIYGCEDSDETIYHTPKPCEMYTQQCPSYLAGWGIGEKGTCLYKETGFRIGKTGFRTILLQFHWNNPELRVDYTDNSGLNVFYTPILRPYDAKMLTVGTRYFEIPPGEQEVKVEGRCSTDCSSLLLTGPVYITMANSHMHYLGRKQTFQQYRNGVWIRDISNIDGFQYDAITEYHFDPPIEVLPGDELRTTCTYQTVSRDKTTFEGEGTSDEMCFVFLRIFPAANTKGSFCLSWKKYDLCKLFTFPSEFPDIDGCKITSMLNPFHPDLISLMSNLKKLCKPFDICTQECKHFIKGTLSNDKCINSELNQLLRQLSFQHLPIYTEVWAAIDSCKTEIEMETCQEQCDSEQ
ncbi:peptidylglycine alpha-amidating monooxygenase-like [Pecten maximus]|uniref:peptidylglycine alpha-amidating monooxygenase-like n=1 Tax=Pecten maximus TaxID=6579 RepID=UPI00145861EF|nr:peptidylglycine alpha-amidating monooxygenase-like [Pecten maximus]